MQNEQKQYHVAILQLFISDGGFRELKAENMAMELKKYIIKEHLDKGMFFEKIQCALRDLSTSKCILSWKTRDYVMYAITSNGYRLLNILH